MHVRFKSWLERPLVVNMLMLHNMDRFEVVLNLMMRCNGMEVGNFAVIVVFDGMLLRVMEIVVFDTVMRVVLDIMVQLIVFVLNLAHHTLSMVLLNVMG